MSQEKENRQYENAQSVQEGQQPHKRRVRYKGRYPKKYEEKYKELQPEKYQDTIQHVMQKGNTPAGMHISIMVKEIIDFLEIKPGQIGFDATLGYGGHTKAMLQCLQGQGHMYATDVDHEEAAKTKKRLEDLGFGEDILTIKLQNFCTIDEIAKEVGGFDFLLADLGVSSMQIDNPKRGLLECFMRIQTSHTVKSLPRRSQMKSAKETTWIPPQSFVRSLRKLWISFRKKRRRRPSKRPASVPSRPFGLM